MGRDELGDCRNGVFFFCRFGDDDVGIRGVSFSFASKFESQVWCFFLVGCSVQGSPMASIVCSFFIKNSKSVPGWCGSFKHESVFLLVGTPPLQVLEIEVDGD